MALEKNIKLKVTAETGQASNALIGLDKATQNTTQSTERLARSTGNSNMLLMSTGRIVQDLPYGFMAIGNNITFMAEQMGYMRTQGMTAKDMLTGMLGALKGPMGIIFAISTATSVLTMFGSKLFGFGQSVDPAIKSVKSLRDEFSELKNEVNQVIAALNFNEIIMMGQRKRGLQGLISSTQGKLDLESRTGERTRLSLELAGYKSELEAITKEQEFQNFAFQKWLKMQEDSVKNAKELNKQTKETTQEIMKGLDASYRFRLGGDASNRGGAGGAGLTSSFLGVGGIDSMTSGKAGKAKESEGFKNQVDFFVSQMKDGIGIIKGEFSTFWEDSFGEANSLLEKFLMNFAEGLMELALKQGFSSLLNMILPGSGALAGMAMGASRQPIVNNYNVDGRTFAQLVVNANKTATMLRMN